MLEQSSQKTLYRCNAFASAVVLLFEILHLGLLPLLIGTLRPAAALIWLFFEVVLTPLRLAVLHESLHGKLFARKSNEIVGRAISAASLLAWEVMRFGHATHHRWTRHELDRPDLARPGHGRNSERLRYAGHLLGGVWLMEVGASLGQLAPRRVREWIVERAFAGDGPGMRDMRTETLRSVRDQRRVAKSRVDVLIGIVLMAGAICLWSDQIWIFALAMALRAVTISLLDNVAHHGTRVAVGAPANDLKLGRAGALMLFNGNYHGTHHRHPGAPWTDLPMLHAKAGTNFQGSYVRALVGQLAGPVRPEDCSA